MATDDATALAERRLIAMEDERDAALLEVDRLRDQLGDALLDAEGHRHQVAWLNTQVVALEATAHHLLDQRDKALIVAERSGHDVAAMRPIVDAAVMASKLRISRELRRAVAEYLRRLEFDP